MAVEVIGDPGAKQLSMNEVAELEADVRLAELAVHCKAAGAAGFLDELVRQRMAAREYKERRAEAVREADLRVVREADSLLDSLAGPDERDVVAARRRLDQDRHFGKAASG